MKVLIPSILMLIIAFSAGYFYKFHEILQEKFFKECEKPNEIKIWFGTPGDIQRDENLERIVNFTKELGFNDVNGSAQDWDIMWTTDYLFDRFTDKIRYQPLKPHQIINHFPGMTFLTNKAHLAVSTTSKYVPSAFNFPNLKNEFLYYAKLFPDIFFALKGFDSKDLQVVDFKEVDYKMSSWRYLQALIQNPILIDGHAFDIGVFVLITSVEPLRIYRWNKEILLRLCELPYEPFDRKIIGKINCALNHKDPSEAPSFMKLVNLYKFSNFDILNNYLDNNEYESDKIWEQIDDAIATVTLLKSQSIERYFRIQRRMTKEQCGNGFELLRYDFIVDTNEKVHLMDVNMSPSLIFSGVDKERKERMMKEILKATFDIVGAGSYNELVNGRNSSFSLSPENIAINMEECATKCEENYEESSCELCFPFLSEELKEIFQKSYREHYRRGEFVRVFPSMKYLKGSKEYKNEMSELTRNLTNWYQGKCLMDEEWC